MSDKIGQVYKSTGSWYNVRDDKGKFYNARVKGKLKIDEDISSSNPIAVGDYVMFEVENEEQDIGIIHSVAERHNYIVRVSPQNRHQKNIVASNLDAALVVATIADPRTSTGFIDRFLITAEAYHIPAIIVINKSDLLKGKHLQQLDEWKDIYLGAGYEMFIVSSRTNEGIDELRTRLNKVTTLFSGHSGVGKSSLINLFIPGIDLKTKQVSDWSGKGQHTTTFAEMFDMPAGGRIIDTPGVKEFGLIDFKKEELAQYFPEMRSRMHGCKFNNCVHINEPGCAIKAAVNEGTVSTERYANYLGILDSIETKW